MLVGNVIRNWRLPSSYWRRGTFYPDWKIGPLGIARGGRTQLDFDDRLLRIRPHLRNRDVRALRQLDHGDKETARIAGNLAKHRNRILDRDDLRQIHRIHTRLLH